MHVVESFCGGVFASVLQTMNHLDPQRFTVSLVYSLRPETPSNFQDLIAPRVRLFELSMVREVEPVKDFWALVQLVRLFVRERPDVVHLHSSKAGVLGRVAARVARIPTVFYSPRSFSFLRQDVSVARRNQYRLLERFAARCGGTIVACSESELDVARQVASKTILVNNAVDVASIDRVIQGIHVHHAPRDRRMTIATAGRIVPQKAPSLFVEVAREVMAARPGQVAFRWIGGGEEGVGLSDQSIAVTGWLSRDEVLKTLYESVDIYLQTSLWEGMPLAVLEAMALGKPVVATDSVGNRDVVVHGQTGFLGSTREALTKALLFLIDDADLRASMGHAGRARVLSEFSLPLLIRKMSDLYRGG